MTSSSAGTPSTRTVMVSRAAPLCGGAAILVVVSTRGLRVRRGPAPKFEGMVPEIGCVVWPSRGASSYAFLPCGQVGQIGHCPFCPARQRHWPGQTGQVSKTRPVCPAVPDFVLSVYPCTIRGGLDPSKLGGQVLAVIGAAAVAL